MSGVNEDPIAPAAPAKPPAALPHPNLGFAVLWTILLLAVQFIATLAISVVAATVFVAVTQRPNDLGDFLNGDFQLLMVPLGTFATFVFAVGVCLLLFGRRVARVLAWRNCAWQQWLYVVLLSVPLAILASEVTNWAEEVVSQIEPLWLREFRTSGSQVLHRLNELPWILVFLSGCLLPGLGEEIYCRGFLSRGLTARYGVLAGTLAASFLFGLMHIYPVQATGAFFLGVVLQFVFLVTRCLPAAVLLHTLNNAFAFTLMRYEQVQIPGLTTPPDGDATHTPWMLLLPSAAAATCLVGLLLQTRTRWQLPDGSEWSPGYRVAEMPPVNVAARAVTASSHPILATAAVLSLVATAAALGWVAQ